MSDWRRVFLVLQISADGALAVKEREGRPIEGSGTWAINTREPGCRTKLIEVVDEQYVSETREAAEKRLKRLKLQVKGK